MDVISHLAFGRALVALAPRSPVAPSRRALTAALIVGAIAPDVDALLMPTGWDRYLMWHERGTHSLLGALLVAAVLASVIRFVIQPLLRRPAALRPAWRHVWFAALAGCLSHLVLDALCGGSLQLFWPLSSVHLTSGLVAMADPWLAGPLVLFVIIAAIWRRRAFELALALFVVMAVVLGMKAFSRAVALRAYTRDVETGAIERPIRVPGQPVSIEARWASATSWYFYDRTSSRVRVWLVDAKTQTVAPYVDHALIPIVSPHDQALIDASRQLDVVKHALSLFEFTFPDVIPRPDGTTDVLWSDVRFCRMEVCDLRFGGRFDRSGLPLEQVVQIGTVRQTRAVSRD